MITFCSDSVICCFAVLCEVALFLFVVLCVTQPGVVCVCVLHLLRRFSVDATPEQASA